MIDANVSEVSADDFNEMLAANALCRLTDFSWGFGGSLTEDLTIANPEDVKYYTVTGYLHSPTMHLIFFSPDRNAAYAISISKIACSIIGMIHSNQDVDEFNLFY